MEPTSISTPPRAPRPPVRSVRRRRRRRSVWLHVRWMLRSFLRLYARTVEAVISVSIGLTLAIMALGLVGLLFVLIAALISRERLSP